MILDTNIDSYEIKELKQQQQLETITTKDIYSPIQSKTSNFSPEKEEKLIRSTSSIIDNELCLTDEKKNVKGSRSQVSQPQSDRIQANRSIDFVLSHHPPLFDSKLDVQDKDYLDSISTYMSFTYLDMLTLSFSIGSFVCDFITDIIVTTCHYLNHDYWYFSLTLLFITVPSLIMTIMSLRWYIIDSKNPNSLPVSTTKWVFRVILLTLQLGPVLRYIDSILYGIEFRKLSKEKKKIARRYFQYMIYEDTDATMLRLFEGFMEAAPQLVLQLTVLIIKMPDKNRDGTAWCLVTYIRMLRMSLANKKNMTYPGAIVQFFWRFFMLSSRVLALSLFASEFTYYIGIVCVVHWLIMFIWIVNMKTTFCDNRIEELFYNAVLALIFIFCYFNPVEGPSRKRYLFYYTVMFIENLIILLLWYNVCDIFKWYRLPAFILFFTSFFIGLIFMSMYYLILHPSQNIRKFRHSAKPKIDQKITGPSSSQLSAGSSLETTMAQSSTLTDNSRTNLLSPKKSKKRGK
uniref:XK-related protein n=1 Tax=Dermatophagoides pteronyssinus TaxID=6956 RepID=A0A6P6Y078_DERPT|nr:XK-related protein 6-like isoform X2 [Dermatophagoides pteronyssinus]